MYPPNPSHNTGVPGGRNTDSGWWNPTTSMPAVWATGPGDTDPGDTDPRGTAPRDNVTDPTQAWTPFRSTPVQRTEPARPEPPEPIEIPDLDDATSDDSDATDGTDDSDGTDNTDATTKNLIAARPDSTGTGARDTDIDDVFDSDFLDPDTDVPLDPLPSPATAYSAVFDASARPDAGRHGTIATEAVADEGMADRISGPAVNRTMRQVGIRTVLPVAAILAVALVRDRSSTTLLLCAAVMVVAALMLVGVVWYAPRRWRRVLAPGTRIVAEFSPAQISYGYAHENVCIPMEKVVSARADESALYLVYKQGLGKATAAIPNELVPSSVALDLTGRFGG